MRAWEPRAQETAGEGPHVIELQRLEAAARARFIARLQAAFAVGAAAWTGGVSPEPVIAVEEIAESMDKPGADS